MLIIRFIPQKSDCFKPRTTGDVKGVIANKCNIFAYRNMIKEVVVPKSFLSDCFNAIGYGNYVPHIAKPIPSLLTNRFDSIRNIPDATGFKTIARFKG